MEAFNDEITLLTDVMRAQFTTGLAAANRATGNWDEVIRKLGEGARTLGAFLPRLTLHIENNEQTIRYVIAALLAWKGALITAGIIAALTRLGRALVAYIKLLRLLTVAQLRAALIPAAMAAGFVALAGAIALAAKSVSDLVSGRLAEGTTFWDAMVINFDAAMEEIEEKAKTAIKSIKDLINLELGDLDFGTGGQDREPGPLQIRVTNWQEGPERERASFTGIRWFQPNIRWEPTPLERSIRSFSERLARSLGDAIRDGDWSSVGLRLVTALRDHFLERTVDDLADIFTTLLTKVFSGVATGGAGGGLGGLGGFSGTSSAVKGSSGG